VGTPPHREWEHNASLSSINSKKFATRALAWWMYGLYWVPFFLLSFLIENAKFCKVVVVTFILPIQSMGYNHALYFIRGDQIDGRNFLLVGCHCIVNMLYYYYCHNIVLVNKLACLQGMICVNRLVYCQQFAIWKFYALYWVTFLVTLWHEIERHCIRTLYPPTW